METLSFTEKNPSELGSSSLLSPEYWISRSLIKSIRSNSGTPLASLAYFYRLTVSSFNKNDLFLDTGNAYNGLLSLRLNSGVPQERLSSKKVLPEGSLIISRLRPYLRQVTYLPKGLLALLDVNRILGSTEFYVLCPQKKDIAFLVPWLLSDDMQSLLSKATLGGHHPRFSESLLEDCVVPSFYIKNSLRLNKSVKDCILLSVKAQTKMAALY
jgi:hypothetical protein